MPVDRWIDESVLRGRQPCFMAPGFWSGSASLAVITQRLTADALASIHMCTCLRHVAAKANTLLEAILNQSSWFCLSSQSLKGGAQSACAKKKKHKVHPSDEGTLSQPQPKRL